MPTATMSQDGTYRIDLRITRRVSTGDLASYLASALRRTELENMPKLTTQQIRKTARDEMERRGTDYIDGWADDFGMTETNDRLAWATDQIRRAYPELAKAEDAQRPAVETRATKTCRHGKTPRPDVTGDPIAECAKADGRTEWGAFNDEGCWYANDCAVDVANECAQENQNAETPADDPYGTWGRICPDHEGETADHCRQCNTEQPSTCKDCDGAGCHWCYWTGRTDA
jgi:hypothetical protein